MSEQVHIFSTKPHLEPICLSHNTTNYSIAGHVHELVIVCFFYQIFKNNEKVLIHPLTYQQPCGLNNVHMA